MNGIKKIKLFRYYGGKYYMLDDVMTEMIRIINKYDIKCVVDVFGGSGTVILSLPLEYKINRVYNDIDKRLVIVLKILMDNKKRENLINSLEFSIRSHDIFNEFKNSEWDRLTDEEIALRFLYLIAYSYSGGLTGYGVNRTHIRDNMGSIINNIKNNWKYVRKLTNIENLDFRDLIKKYGSERTLFYLDPPYLTSGKQYKYSFSENNFYDLKELLDITKSKYILNSSGVDFDFMNKIFGNYTFVKQYINYVNLNKGIRLEGFWIKEG